MIRTCQHCGKEFEARTCAKYCPTCRPNVYRQLVRNWYNKRQPEPDRRTLTNAELRQLLKLIRDAYQLGWLFVEFGGESALTEEQLALVEAKYPDHRKTLGDQRQQKFFDAADKFIALYQSFNRGDRHGTENPVDA